MANRSGRAGTFLSATSRHELVMDMVNEERRKKQAANPQTAANEGCNVCHKDNDHSNMLLCEGCNDEYHFYCVQLRAIPTDDWFCASCKADKKDKNTDDLDLLVAALPPVFTSKFGRIVWAQGGPGYGWWPCYVYDPRRTLGVSRDLAVKNLRKKHLLYFFQCETPFAALAENKLCSWMEGMAESHHLGKAARNAGRQRAAQFGEALKIALLELAKPIDERMSWNHPGPIAMTTTTGSPVKTAPSCASASTWTPQRRHRKSKKHKLAAISVSTAEDGIRLSTVKVRCSRTNLQAALMAHNSVNSEDDDLYIRLVVNHSKTPLKGFCRIQKARKRATFSDVRREIWNQRLGDIPDVYKFEIPDLGVVSERQEDTLGSLWNIYIKAVQDFDSGDGTIRRPLKIHLVTEDASAE